jgi:hypothetical protein
MNTYVYVVGTGNLSCNQTRKKSGMNQGSWCKMEQGKGESATLTEQESLDDSKKMAWTLLRV